MTKRYIYGLAIGLLVVGTTMVPTQAMAATTYYYSSADIAVRLQALIAQLRELERQLAEIRGTTGGSYGRSDVSRVDVELFDDYAEVSIRYRDGDRDEMLFDADSRNEVIDFLVDETRNSRTHLLAVTYFSQGDEDDYEDIDDIRRIDVEIRNGDAHVEVRYEDGERDTFTIRDEDDEDDIIEEIADELNLDEDDVEDLIDFDDDGKDADDIDEIEVTIYEDEDEADAWVRYDNGRTSHYSFNTDDEDEIIEDLADLLDIDEDDVEDLADFEYEDGSNEDIDEIEVTIYEDEDEATARVRYDDGGTTTYRFDTEDEDDIIEDLAELLDLDEDEVEDLIDFEYED